MHLVRGVLLGSVAIDVNHVVAGVHRTYARREPKRTTLSQVLRDHLATFIAEREAQDRNLPTHVVRTLKGLLTCGDLASGFARFRCRCGTERLVAFSCKDRSVCASCMSRRQTRIASHATDRVLPEVPIRQWTASFPFWLRYRLAFDHALVLALHREFIRAVTALYRKKAAQAGVRGGRTGALTVVQRFGSGCELNPHFHSAFLDGAFAEGEGGELIFHRVEAPTPAELEALCVRLRDRAKVHLMKAGLWEDDEAGGRPTDTDDAPTMADLFTLSAQQRVATGERAGQRVAREQGAEARPVADGHKTRVAGFDIHASSPIGRKRRDRREQLMRYLLRPPLSAERLSLSSGGRVRLALKTPWRDGTTALLLQPADVLARLAALVCPPRANQVLFSGVLAAHSAWRRRVVPEAPAEQPPAAPMPNTDASAHAPTRSNPDWATLMKRGLDLDVLTCPACGGRLRHIASILQRDVIRRILDHLGLRSDPPTFAPARTLPLFEPADWA